MKNAIRMTTENPVWVSQKKNNIISRLYIAMLKEYSESPYGYATIGIIGQSCLGSIAVMFLLMNNDIPRAVQMIELFLVTILCLGFNGSVLSQQKHNVQVNLLITSIIVSTICIIINLI